MTSGGIYFAHVVFLISLPHYNRSKLVYLPFHTFRGAQNEGRNDDLRLTAASRVYIQKKEMKERKKKPSSSEASPVLSGNTNPDEDTNIEEEFISRRVRKRVDVSESSEDELIRNLSLYLLYDFRCDFGHIVTFLVDIW